MSTLGDAAAAAGAPTTKTNGQLIELDRDQSALQSPLLQAMAVLLCRGGHRSGAVRHHSRLLACCRRHVAVLLPAAGARLGGEVREEDGADALCRESSTNRGVGCNCVTCRQTLGA